MSGCPSCDRDLSYPGAPGHECYTYAEWRARQFTQEPCLCDTDFTCIARSHDGND